MICAAHPVEVRVPTGGLFMVPFGVMAPAVGARRRSIHVGSLFGVPHCIMARRIVDQD